MYVCIYSFNPKHILIQISFIGNEVWNKSGLCFVMLIISHESILFVRYVLKVFSG